MKTIYESTITLIGSAARESIEDNFIIMFGEGAPPEVAEYCFIHHTELDAGKAIGTGSVMIIGDTSYPITAIGDVVQDNLRELGHITVRFDGAAQAEFAGTVHVAGIPPAFIEPGLKFRISGE